MRRCELPSRAFLGKMVVGHKNSKVMKPPLRVNNENIRGNCGYSGKRECENTLYKVFVNTLFSFSEKEVFLANCENIRWNHARAGIIVF